MESRGYFLFIAGTSFRSQAKIRVFTSNLGFRPTFAFTIYKENFA